MSTVYDKLCNAIKEGQLNVVKSITNSIIDGNKPETIKLVYALYSENKDHFKSLYTTEALTKIELTPNVIELMQRTVDLFLSSLIVKHQLLTTLSRKRKNTESSDEPSNKRHKTIQNTPHFNISPEDDIQTVLAKYGFNSNQIETIVTFSNNLDADIEQIPELLARSFSSYRLHNFIKEGKTLSDVHQIVNQLEKLKYEIDDKSFCFTNEQINAMLATEHSLTRCQYIVAQWEAIKKTGLTLTEIVKLAISHKGKRFNEVFLYLPKLREKKCPLKYVTAVGEKTAGHLLKFVFLHYEALEDYGWDKIENMKIRELGALIRELEKNHSQADKPANPVHAVPNLKQNTYASIYSQVSNNIHRDEFMSNPPLYFEQELNQPRQEYIVHLHTMNQTPTPASYPLTNHLSYGDRGDYGSVPQQAFCPPVHAPIEQFPSTYYPITEYQGYNYSSTPFVNFENYSAPTYPTYTSHQVSDQFSQAFIPFEYRSRSPQISIQYNINNINVYPITQSMLPQDYQPHPLNQSEQVSAYYYPMERTPSPFYTNAPSGTLFFRGATPPDLTASNGQSHTIARDEPNLYKYTKE
ncbi:MAG: hypothetical protein Q8M40_11580 [Legionella sp.]|nr:hypothetical protein [Legionella sp.]